jgi:hypothetical protein
MEPAFFQRINAVYGTGLEWELINGKLLLLNGWLYIHSLAPGDESIRTHRSISHANRARCAASDKKDFSIKSYRKKQECE